MFAMVRGHSRSVLWNPAFSENIQPALSYCHAAACAVTNFQGYVPRTANWGVSLTREKFKLQTKWNYGSKRRNGPVAAARGIDAATFNWTSKRLLVDVIGEYHFSKRWSVFANLNNVGDTPNSLEISSPNTPEIAQFRQRIHYGSLWTCGIKAIF
jgi:hypothetical protein